MRHGTRLLDHGVGGTAGARGPTRRSARRGPRRSARGPSPPGCRRAVRPCGHRAARMATPGRLSSQAMATCDIGRSWRRATLSTTSRMRHVRSRSACVVRLDSAPRVLAQPSRAHWTLVAPILARQPPTGERRPRGDGDGFVQAAGQHLPLDATIEQVVLRLQHGRTHVAPEAGGRHDPLQLPTGDVGPTDLVDLAGPNLGAQRVERVLDGRLLIPAMDEVQIDRLHSQTIETGRRWTAPATAARRARRARRRSEAALRRDHYVLGPAGGEPSSTMRSDSPPPYTSAVSTNVPPRSMNRSSCALESSASLSTPNVIVPSPSRETAGPPPSPSGAVAIESTMRQSNQAQHGTPPGVSVADCCVRVTASVVDGSATVTPTNRLGLNPLALCDRTVIDQR